VEWRWGGGGVAGGQADSLKRKRIEWSKKIAEEE
jgi:hypothetical protein